MDAGLIAIFEQLGLTWGGDRQERGRDSHALSALLSVGMCAPNEKAARRRPLPQRTDLKSGLNLKAPGLKQRLRDVLRIFVSPCPLP
jgi:hypothetical protein